jgi:adenosylhomocysteine nucleosidase
MTGIITAMGSEAAPLLENMSVNKQFELAGKKCFKGSINGNEVILIISEIGKVNAASATQALITRFPEIDKIINIGVAGAVNPDLKICDICVIEKTIQYDFDITSIDSVPIGYIQNIKQQYIYCDKKLYGKLMTLFSQSATVATADRFSDKQAEAELILSLGGDLREMEVGAVSQVCILNNIPFAAVKAVSDTAKGNASADFKENLDKCCLLLAKNIEKIICAVNNE